MKNKTIQNTKTIFKKEFTSFKDSFKDINSDFLFIIFYDLVLYAFFIAIPKLWNSFIMSHPLAKESALIQDINSLTAEQIAALNPMFGSFFRAFAVSIIIAALILFAVYVLTRCLIWCSIEKKKFSLSYFKKSLLLNLVWLPLLLIIIALLSFVAALLMVAGASSMILSLLLSFIFVIIFLMFININFLVYHLFTKNNKIFLSIGSSFRLLFSKFKRFIVPLLFMAVIFSIISFPFGALKSLQEYTIVQILLSIVYLAWLRIYIVKLAKKEV